MAEKHDGGDAVDVGDVDVKVEEKGDFARVEWEVRPGRMVSVQEGKKSPSAAAVHRVFFIHGAGGRLDQFRLLQKELFSEVGFECGGGFDWLGHGLSARPDDWDAYHGDELFRDVELVYRRLMVPDGAETTTTEGKKDGSVRRVVVAHSYGTAMAVRLAANPENKVDAIVLLGPLTWEKPAAASSLGLYLPCFVLEWLRPAISKQFADAVWHANTDRALVEFEAEISSKNPFYVVKPLSRLMVPATRDQFMALENVPALVVAGVADKVTPVQHAEAIDKILPKSTLKVMENSGHQIMLEEPKELADHIRAFLGECVPL